METFTQLKKNIKNINESHKTLKVAVLGDTATQFLVMALQGTGAICGYNLIIFEAEYDQIERQVFDPSSDLYEFNPEIIIIFHATQKLLKKYNCISLDKQLHLAENQINSVEYLVSVIQKKLTSKIIYLNYPEINDQVFGNFANKIESSFIFQLRKLNYLLIEFATKHSNLYIADLASLHHNFGKEFSFQSSVYINSDMVLSLDILPYIAARIVDIIGALQGKIKKCLVLDLDNTLWGGIIGDDGLENIQLGTLGIGKAFTEFQYWIKKLKNRGIILTVCSKNTEKIAKEVFEKHPDMILRLDDIAVFVANWENKADNIRFIQSVLNIGFDSIVFLDDNPFERNLVRENIPEITIPELPDDPADYLEYLYSLNLFETISFSNEDIERTKQYQTEANRTIVQKSFTNEDEFLKSLEMHSVVEPFNQFNTPRVAQLSQRSNQFNLRTVRYTERDIQTISQSSNFFSFSFSLADKFGDYGMICAIILKKDTEDTLFIESWFMSCRVLKRGMEKFVLNIIASFAKETNYKFLKGEYIPTAKNEMVKDHYVSLGFTNNGNYWHMDVIEFKKSNCYIEPIYK